MSWAQATTPCSTENSMASHSHDASALVSRSRRKREKCRFRLASRITLSETSQFRIRYLQVHLKIDTPRAASADAIWLVSPRLSLGLGASPSRKVNLHALHLSHTSPPSLPSTLTSSFDTESQDEVRDRRAGPGVKARLGGQIISSKSISYNPHHKRTRSIKQEIRERPSSWLGS